MSAANFPKLLLTAREAAECLSISEKTLWNYTVPRGSLRCVRIGRRVLYSVEALRAWMERQEERCLSSRAHPRPKLKEGGEA